MKFNDFMGKLYSNGVGKAVVGTYWDSPFTGVIAEVRSRYGNDLAVTVMLDQPIEVRGHRRDSVLLDGSELYKGGAGVTKDLQINL